MFSVSVVLYLANLQYFVRHWVPKKKIGTIENTTFKDALQSFGSMTYQQFNPVDQAKCNLEIYQNKEILICQEGSLKFIRIGKAV